jgi:hypothetical protein
MTNRRDFVLKFVPLAGAAAVLPRMAMAADVPDLTEADPMAKAMHFVLDAGTTKDAKHVAGTSCASCLHFTKAGADKAKCDLFSKNVPKGGWCTGYSKRP